MKISHFCISNSLKLVFIIEILLLTLPALTLGSYVPPIGIPAPHFGVDDTHMMYANCSMYTYDYGSGPECYRIGPDGPYTHYVDPNHPSATDTANPFGTEDVPRLNRPNFPEFSPAPAGTVVYLKGGTQGGYGALYTSGTANQPVFFRGDPIDKPTWTGVIFPQNSYLIIENMKFDLEVYARKTIAIGAIYEGARSHITIRNNEFFNGMYDPTSSYQVIRIKHDYNSTDQVRDIVVYNNYFHHIGHGRSTPVKKDVVGVSVDVGAENVWIIDNVFHDIGGDGIQIASDSSIAGETYVLPNHIYIGKNTGYNFYENLLDLKMCRDVVVSQNTIHNTGGGLNSGMVPFRYGTGGDALYNEKKQNIWTLFNTVYNHQNPDGAFIAYDVSTQALPTEHYFIGNIVYNAQNDTQDANAFGQWDIETTYWLHNTTYNTEVSANFFGDRYDTFPDEKLTVVNNIFGDISSTSSTSGTFLLGATQASLDRAEIHHNLFYDDADKRTFRVGVYPPIATWTNYPTFADFCGDYPAFCGGSMVSDPLHMDALNADFNLLWNSPAIDAGVDHAAYETYRTRFGVSIEVDYFSNPIYGPPDIGAIEYQPPYTMGVDEIDIAANVRVYGDGKFRNTLAPGGTTAPLAIIPASGNTREYLDVAVTTWAATKGWTETAASTITGSVSHAVEDLTPATPYAVYYTKDTGARTLLAVRTADALGEISFTYLAGYSTVTFEVEEDPGPADTTLPSVSMTAPGDGATVSGTVTVSATAIDNVRVVGVQFTLDGANLGPVDVEEPYTVFWDTTTAGNGPHTLSAIAYDPSGNMASATDITVTVVPLPTATMSADPASITEGESSILTWSSTNAANCIGTNFATGGATSGFVSVSPVTETTFSVNCDDATTSATVTVNPAVPGNSHRLQVGITGKGGGSVFSSMEGISCPGDCAQLYSPDTTVTLTAVPDDRSTFKQWQGDCAGTEPVCTLTMGEAKNATAIFYYFPWPLFLPAIENGQQ